MKVSRRRLLRLTAGSAALTAASRLARAQGYPSRPVRIVVGFAAGGAERHQRASHRPMVVGTIWSAIHHRQPAWRQRQHRHGDGGRSPPDGYTLLMIALSSAVNATLFRTCRSSSCATSRPSQHQPQHLRDGGPSLGAGQDRARADRLRQGQSEQDQHGVARQRHRRRTWRASCSR